MKAKRRKCKKIFSFEQKEGVRALLCLVEAFSAMNPRPVQGDPPPPIPPVMELLIWERGVEFG